MHSSFAPQEINMPKHGKKYIAASAKVERNHEYTPEEAIALAKETSITKFPSTVELHLRTGVDPRHADQQVRGVVVMPAGTGKQVRILVFAEGEGVKFAEEAGADFVGSDELIKKVQDGWIEFDLVLATPQVMGKAGRLGKVLGPRGLMPTPKTGTIVQPEDLPRVIQEARQGRVEFRVDKTANIHVPIGKSDFTPEQLMENLTAIMDAIVRAKPTTTKGIYIRRATITTTMGPGISVDVNLASALTPNA